MIGIHPTGLLLPTHRHKSSEPNFSQYFNDQNISQSPSTDENFIKYEQEDTGTRNDIIFQEQSSADVTTLVLAAATMEKLTDWLLLSEGIILPFSRI
jgi:hypothetical protein